MASSENKIKCDVLVVDVGCLAHKLAVHYGNVLIDCNTDDVQQRCNNITTHSKSAIKSFFDTLHSVVESDNKPTHIIGVFDGVSKRENSDISKSEVGNFNRTIRTIFNSPTERRRAAKSFLQSYRLSTDERCWFQTLLADQFDEVYQSNGSSDPVIYAIAKKAKTEKKTVGVVSIDSDLHATALAVIDFYIWMPKTLFSSSISFMNQHQIINHYRQAFNLQNRQQVDDARLMRYVAEARRLAGE